MISNIIVCNKLHMCIQLVGLYDIMYNTLSFVFSNFVIWHLYFCNVRTPIQDQINYHKTSNKCPRLRNPWCLLEACVYLRPGIYLNTGLMLLVCITCYDIGYTVC